MKSQFLTNVITGTGIALPKGVLLQDNPKMSYLAKAYVKAAGFKKVMGFKGSSSFFPNFENQKNPDKNQGL